MSGYVRIHRTLIGHPAFRNDAEAMAFAWMVAKAAWKPIRVRYKERAIHLQRGQLAVSQRDMARALDRDKAWIERLWKRLRAEAMITVAVEAGVAVITICNYVNYQASDDRREAVGEAPQEAGARQGQGTEQGREEVKKKEDSSVANATGAEPPDLLKVMFDDGLALLTSTGTPEKQARSLLGKWKKAKGEAEVLVGLADCRAKRIEQPVEWLEKRFQAARYVSPKGYEYRGSDLDVMREAERRGDNGTYWAAKRALNEKPKPEAKPRDRRGGTRAIGDLIPQAGASR